MQHTWKKMWSLICISNLMTPVMVQLPKLDPSAASLPSAAARQANTNLIFLQAAGLPAVLMMNQWCHMMPWSCGPCPPCAKGSICFFSDIHDPKGIRHQRPVNEKAFSATQSLGSLVHLCQFGEKNFWHRGILQGRLMWSPKAYWGLLPPSLQRLSPLINIKSSFCQGCRDSCIQSICSKTEHRQVPLLKYKLFNVVCALIVFNLELRFLILCPN